MLEQIDSSQLLQLTNDLLRIPSVTGDQEQIGHVNQLIKSELSAYSMEEFVDPKTGSRSLLFYNTPTRPERFRFLLNGHIDVVPAKPEMFDPNEADGNLYARGADDMKASVAAQVLVFKQLADKVPFPMALQIVSDEETGGSGGTEYQVDTQHVAADFVIGGESTNLAICNERKGFQRMTLTARGRGAHSAYAYQGDNAVIKLSRVITQMSDRYPVPKEGEWATSFSAATLSRTTNREFNIVPDRARARIETRSIPSESAEEILATLREIAPESEGFTIRTDSIGDPMYTDPTHPDILLLSRAIEEVVGKPAELIRKPGGADGRFYTRRGMAAVDFGTVGDFSHGDGEYVVIQSISDYAKILSRFIELLSA